MQIEQLTAAINDFVDPYNQQKWGDSKIKWHYTPEALAITLGYPCQRAQEEISQALRLHLESALPASKIPPITIDSNIASHRVQHSLSGIDSIKNIIAVGSGKGGVGKSTVSANLALALVQEGAKVGLLDADIYGPSQTKMFDAMVEPTITADKKIMPIERYGLRLISIGNLVDINSAMIWRGPMVSKALQQLLHDTQWGQLDYLIVDLPPGTGDIQLTMAQKIPVSGSVVVTTPQDLSLLDARRAIAMFNKVKIPVLGIIENMSLFNCPKCGHTSHIFGHGGGQSIATQYQVPLLGQLPLTMQLREQTDAGRPTVIANPDSEIGKTFSYLGCATAATLALTGKDYAKKFPNIVVEKDS